MIHGTRHTRRGTALIEFVMCIPLLALIIAGTYFFGMVMRNDQRLCVSDRYHAWRVVQNADAETDMRDQAHRQFGEPDENAEYDQFCSAYREVNVTEPSGEYINERFLQMRASEVEISHHGGTRDTLDELEESAYEKSSDAGDLARESLQRWPHGSVSRIDAEFPQEQEALKSFVVEGDGGDGDMETRVYYRRGYRDGVQWRRWQNSYLEPIRELFLYELDDAVENVADGTIRDNLKDLYLERW